MTNSEQAIREFVDKWGFSQDKTDEGFLIDNDRTKQCLSDLTALIEEHYVKKEEHEKLVNAALQNKPQPTAEGAEEILDGMDLGEPIQTGEFYYRSEVLEAMNKFATLHAQRIAEKMVEERMEQYKAQFKDRPNPLEVNPYDSKGIKRIRNRKIH